MFDSEQAILDMEIRTLNKADLLILPSKKMHRYLKEMGLMRSLLSIRLSGICHQTFVLWIML